MRVEKTGSNYHFFFDRSGEKCAPAKDPRTTIGGELELGEVDYKKFEAEVVDIDGRRLDMKAVFEKFPGLWEIPNPVLISDNSIRVNIGGKVINRLLIDNEYKFPIPFDDGTLRIVYTPIDHNKIKAKGMP